MTIYTVKMATVLDSGWLPRLIGTVIYQILPTRNQCCRIRQTFLFNVKVFLFQQGLTLVLQFFFFFIYLLIWFMSSRIEFKLLLRTGIPRRLLPISFSVSRTNESIFFLSRSLSFCPALNYRFIFFFLTYLDV